MRQTARFDYFYGMQADAYSFYRIPKVLFTDDFFKSLSCEAKVLYGLMLDRMSLSVKNRWFDEEDRVYIIFTVEETMEMMNCSKPKAVKIISELDTEKGIGLIEKKRLGLGKANIIYVKNFILTDAEDGYEEELPENRKNPQKSKSFTSRSKNSELQEVKKRNSKKLKKETSESTDYLLQEVKKVDCNYTDNNNTEYSDTNQSIHQMQEEDMVGKYALYRNLIKDNIEYDVLCQTYQPREVNEIVDLMVETVCSNREAISINGEFIPTEIIKSRFLKINYMHIQYIFECLHKNVTSIRNIRQYLLTVIYNAPATINHYYQARVNHDMYGMDY